MQHEVTSRQKLLDKKGHIVEEGWARHPIWEYSRKDIKALKIRIKEWDYYLIGNKDRYVAFTITDCGYMGLLSASYIDTKNVWEQTHTDLFFFPMGKFNLGSTSDDGNAILECKKSGSKLQYKTEKGKRTIECHIKNFKDKMDFNCNITLSQRDMESMNIATSWKENRKAFYYNQKIATMPACGYVQLGDDIWNLDPNVDSGILDWGRGRWTYDNRWYWGIGSDFINGEKFGFNLGYGFSDRTPASENLIYYKDKVHKLEDVDFIIPTKSSKPYDYDFYKQWKITSSDKRFEVTFDPIINRKALISVLMITSDQNQIFGRMNGFCILDDGSKIDLVDFPAAVEVVHNKY